jgi:organic radical activating enzyme
VLRDAAAHGVRHVSFTGGEPTLHRDLTRIVETASAAGLTFSVVSNASTFGKVYRLLIEHRASFQGVTFSLDGAREETHDRLRGQGSFRQVMRAASVANFTGLPFTFNLVLTAGNRGDVAETVRLFGYLMAGDGVDDALALSLDERRTIEDEIRVLQKAASIPVLMAPGYFSESPFFPCGPLEGEEVNVDCRGNLTLCCQLSGFWADGNRPDIVANLHDMSFAEAVGRFRRRVLTYLGDKRARVASGTLSESDHFPCLYCVRYLGSVPRRVTLHTRVALAQA